MVPTRLALLVALVGLTLAAAEVLRGILGMEALASVHLNHIRLGRQEPVVVAVAEADTAPVQGTRAKVAVLA